MSWSIALYLLLLVLIYSVYIWMRSGRHRKSRSALEASIATGMTEPVSIHPVVDHARCLGCASCIPACPEKNVLGLIHAKAHLVNPTHCIGHGACKTACPFNAIELVFGTEKRGIDIPLVDPEFQTNVPGIYIAGELGGMGLIRNAVNQGVQAVDSISRLNHAGTGDEYDLVIIGAGPAGIAASLAAREKGMKFVTLEQDSLGGTVSHYPRGKIVMTAPVDLPLVGKMHFRETSKEALMKFWKDIVDRTGLVINDNDRVYAVVPTDTGFQVNARSGSYQARAVLLAIGRRGTPRKLGVPGEDRTKVVYRLIDPEQYRNQHVLVVGGGDSALEAAVSIADEAGTRVTLSYRSEAFSRARDKNRNKVAEAARNGKLNVMMKSSVTSIDDRTVTINDGNTDITLDNDTVIVCAGGILPTAFLKSMGIQVDTKYGTA